MHRSRQISLSLSPPPSISRGLISGIIGGCCIEIISIRWIIVNSRRREGRGRIWFNIALLGERFSRATIFKGLLLPLNSPCLPYFRFVYRHSHFLCYILASRYSNPWLRLSISFSLVSLCLICPIARARWIWNEFFFFLYTRRSKDLFVVYSSLSFFLFIVRSEIIQLWN